MLFQFNQVDIQNFTIWLEQNRLDSFSATIPVCINTTTSQTVELYIIQYKNIIYTVLYPYKNMQLYNIYTIYSKQYITCITPRNSQELPGILPIYMLSIKHILLYGYDTHSYSNIIYSDRISTTKAIFWCFCGCMNPTLRPFVTAAT